MQFWNEIAGGVTAPQGFWAGGVAAGLKPSGVSDVALTLSDCDATAAGVFTTNQVPAACVTYNRAVIASGQPVRAVICNAGQANACTGEAGDRDNAEIAKMVADALAIQSRQVLTAATGVIGRRIEVEKLRAALPALVELVQTGDRTAGGETAANAIRTTDLVAKTAAVEAEVAGKLVRIGGMAKGSGMIHPDMATMLAFVTCDATVECDLWQLMLKRAVDRSFNQITVDGDTSTNDMVLALANGRSGTAPVVSDSPDAERLQAMLDAVCVSLAKAIARDGEGATTLVEVEVMGAFSTSDARTIARTIAGSPLVKAAIYGNDPNWGRVAMAAGRAGVVLDPRAMDIAIGTFQLMKAGVPIPFDAAAASDYLKGDWVVIRVHLHQGDASGTAWGCDLSYDYVRINAEYTT